jgi:hypothetical protein
MHNRSIAAVFPASGPPDSRKRFVQRGVKLTPERRQLAFPLDSISLVQNQPSIGTLIASADSRRRLRESDILAVIE